MNNKLYEKFTEALRLAVRGQQTRWSGEMSADDWEALFALCREQHVLPLVLNAVYVCPDFLALGSTRCRELKMEAARRTAAQTCRTEALKSLAQKAESRGLHFLLMKGAACRSLYPLPDARTSSDEDLLVPGEEFVRWTDFLLGEGFKTEKEGCSPETDFETGFVRSDLYVELHRSPFAPGYERLGSFNALFEGAFERGSTLCLDGVAIPVMGPGDHMLYLLFHAYKHLVHSGFGLRQLCDIMLWAEKYAVVIDSEALTATLQSRRCLGFARAAFGVACMYLGMDAAKAPIAPGLDEALCRELVEDMLSGGVYGSADLSRLHSSTITLGAVESGSKTPLRSLFPPLETMKGTYPWLDRHPWLLPAAWLGRMAGYALSLSKKNKPSESLRIGARRRELLKKLDIID